MARADGLVRTVPVAGAGVFVYLLDLDGAPPGAGLLSLLSEGERARAGRLKGHRGPERFVARRWGLRVAVAEATGTAPERVSVEWDDQGRPRIREGVLRISTSSFGPWGLVALGSGALGVDLLGPEAEAIAAAAALAVPLFADALRLGGTGQADPRRAWTHLEAALKASGLGFDVPQAKGAVRAESWREDGESFLRVEHPHVGASRWSAVGLNVPEGFVASLVVPCA